MIQVSFSSHFVKALRKRLTNKISERRFFQKLEVFTKNPFYPSLKTHKLSGDLESYWSFSIEYDLRVIFYFLRIRRWCLPILAHMMKFIENE